MSGITTVLGKIPPTDLGFCQSHEHLCIEKGRSAAVNPALCIDNPECTLAEVQEYRTAGGRAIVDAQPVGCGRGALTLADLSGRGNIHIIASTGFHKMIFYPSTHWILKYGEAQLAEIFITELRQGMYIDCDKSPPKRQCQHRAGLIKTALDNAFTTQYRKLFSAAARAALQTGAPLMAHIEKDSDPVALADFLEESGLALNRVIFCHMDRMVPDLAVHKTLCRRGVVMEYDTIARGQYHSDAHEIQLLTHMLDAGFGNQLLLSLDVTRNRMLHYGGQVGLSYILNHFIPLLHKNGVHGEAIEKIFCTNPASVFAQA